MGKNRFAKASKRNRFDLWSSANDPKGIYVKQHAISVDLGEAMCLTGSAMRVEDADGMLVCYQLAARRDVTKTMRVRTLVRVCSTETPQAIAITKAEVEANAGLRGRSRTAGLTEVERVRRVLMGMPAEDATERARTKIAVYDATH